MKNVLPAIGLCLLLCTAAQTSQAQIIINMTGSFALPQGTLADATGNGIGVSGAVKYMFSDNTIIGAKVGYLSFGQGDLGSNEITTYTGLFDYVLGENVFRPYAGSEIGLYNVNTSTDLRFIGQVVTVNETERVFGFAPKAGLLVHLGEVQFDVNVGYYLVRDLNHVAMNFGINVLL